MNYNILKDIVSILAHTKLFILLYIVEQQIKLQ